MFTARWNALVEYLAEALTIKPKPAKPSTWGVTPDGTKVQHRRDTLLRSDQVVRHTLFVAERGAGMGFILGAPPIERHISALEKGGLIGGKGWEGFPSKKDDADLAP